MFTGKLDGAWRVVARSLSATSSLSRMVSPGPSRNADCNLAPNLAERVAIWQHARRTKLIGYKARKKNVR